MRQIGQQIGEFVLENAKTRLDDGRRLEGSSGLDVEVKTGWLAVANVVSLVARVVLRKLSVLAAWPFLGLRVGRMAEGVVGIVLKGDAARWVPLGVLLCETCDGK